MVRQSQSRDVTVNSMRIFVCIALLLFGIVASAQTQPAAPPADNAADATTLDTVLVTGEQPGPGLWKVSKGDHVLWILGTQYPLPKKMIWRAQQVEETIAQSQEVIADATGKVDIGFFRMLTLVPAVLSARKNPDHASLRDVLSPELYARWTALKEKYIGRDTGVERLRPMLAANELYDKALDKSGLVKTGEIWASVKKAAKKNNVRITEPEASIPVDDPKQTIRDFESTTGDLDAACLDATMKRLESDLDAMRQRANAWAIGDIAALGSLPHGDLRRPCLNALSTNPRLRDQLDAAHKRVVDVWIAAAEKALAENHSTFALLPMSELLDADGRLAPLRAKGYTVEEPE
jgi:uncharacterized protein YbaP (TraB family)